MSDRDCRECGKEGTFSVTVRGKVYWACREHAKELPSLNKMTQTTREIVAHMTRHLVPATEESER